jgi:hypothetical protein
MLKIKERNNTLKHAYWELLGGKSSNKTFTDGFALPRTLVPIF